MKVCSFTIQPVLAHRDCNIELLVPSSGIIDQVNGRPSYLLEERLLMHCASHWTHCFPADCQPYPLESASTLAFIDAGWDDGILLRYNKPTGKFASHLDAPRGLFPFTVEFSGTNGKYLGVSGMLCLATGVRVISDRLKPVWVFGRSWSRLVGRVGKWALRDSPATWGLLDSKFCIVGTSTPNDELSHRHLLCRHNV